MGVPVKLCTTGRGALTCFHAVVLIGPWSTHAALANKMSSASGHDLNHMLRVSLLFTIIFTLFHFHSNISWPCFSDGTAILREYLLCSLHSWLYSSEYLISNIPPRFRWVCNVHLTPSEPHRCGRDKVSVFCVVFSAHLHCSWVLWVTSALLCFQHLVFMRVGLCVYVLHIWKDDPEQHQWFL